MVERNLAKVDVESSNLFTRSIFLYTHLIFSNTLSDGPLLHPVRPSAVGGLRYHVTGFPADMAGNYIQMMDGRSVSPVDLSFVKNESDGSFNQGNTPWLMQQFGLA